MSTDATEHEIRPFVMSRVGARLDEHGDAYHVDDEGNLIGQWDAHLFRFFSLGNDGEVLQIRGRWARELPRSEFGAVLFAANGWADNVIWPKIYVRVEDDIVRVYTEHSVDYTHGVTDAQLDLHIRCGLGASLGFFQALDEQYPADE
ncbi:YbjN domain-containing protein [Cellulomonas sp.]|uniref:YbjN domain-containing protein n=1 Tax=Cellulomonas sp. TaxID=40001 RepID=UPI001B2F028A|nr:YbjN domain-containing protein [Cellulomonas sp.]MBO9554107.1 YbjN domain-containing protein [Cellulomonas sp.]